MEPFQSGDIPGHTNAFYEARMIMLTKLGKGHVFWIQPTLPSGTYCPVDPRLGKLRKKYPVATCKIQITKVKSPAVMHDICILIVSCTKISFDPAPNPFF